VSYPPEFLYTKDHEWIRVDGDVGTIGITDYAQKELGDIVFVELPRPGDLVTAAESFGTVESVKAVSDVYAPVTGSVAAVNPKLQDKPELINSDPHGEGWLIRVRLANREEAEKLMAVDEYEAYLREAKTH
jgi:glycine cleavage system H protein